MKKFAYSFFFFIAWAVPAFWEFLLLVENPLQIFNPFLQFKVLWWTVTTPIFWVANIIGLLILLIPSKSKKVDHNI